jgi:hypothetical protein
MKKKRRNWISDNFEEREEDIYTGDPELDEGKVWSEEIQQMHKDSDEDDRFENIVHDKLFIKEKRSNKKLKDNFLFNKLRLTF